MKILQDRSRYEAIQQKAIANVAQAYKPQRIPDLGWRLVVARSFLGISLKEWSARQIGHLIYGGAAPTTGAPLMTRMQQGASVSPIAMAMLAQFINYFTDDPIDMTKMAPDDRIAEVAQWIESGVVFSDSITADDLTGDVLAMCRKLRGAMNARNPTRASILGDEAIHKRLMEFLFAPLRHANWDTRLIIRDRRTPRAAREKNRFGSDQKVGTNPENWTPAEVASPDYIIEYGLPKKTDQPLDAWLVTVRDPSVLNILGKRAADRWVWQEGWDRVIRWLPPFHLPKGAEIVAPTSDNNTPAEMLPGLYRVFLLTEAVGRGAISTALWREGEQSARPNIPDEAGYIRLAEALDDGSLKAPDIQIFTGSYVIPDKAGSAE